METETYQGWDRAIDFMRRRVWLLMFVSFALMFAFGALTPRDFFEKPRPVDFVQATHRIAIALFNYAQDHNGKYPEGKTSTEVFQHLVDAGFIASPDLLYFPLDGKVRPASATGKFTLKPESVCYDVTSGVTEDSPDELPLVYLTGYRVTYQAGVPPVRLANGLADGIAVAYKNLGAKFFFVDPDHNLHDFIPATFDPKGQAYRQLTPDGR